MEFSRGRSLRFDGSSQGNLGLSSLRRKGDTISISHTRVLGHQGAMPSWSSRVWKTSLASRYLSLSLWVFTSSFWSEKGSIRTLSLTHTSLSFHKSTSSFWSENFIFHEQWISKGNIPRIVILGSVRAKWVRTFLWIWCRLQWMLQNLLWCFDANYCECIRSFYQFDANCCECMNSMSITANASGSSTNLMSITVHASGSWRNFDVM